MILAREEEVRKPLASGTTIREVSKHEYESQEEEAKLVWCLSNKMGLCCWRACCSSDVQCALSNKVGMVEAR